MLIPYHPEVFILKKTIVSWHPLLIPRFLTLPVPEVKPSLATWLRHREKAVPRRIQGMG